MLFDSYKNKTVLITGNTGFKGSWLTIWLKLLGARVVGLSLNTPSKPNNYKVSGIENQLEMNFLDVRDIDDVKSVVEQCQPDFIFHLAAQALVKHSYESPLETFSTNAIGSANILEAARLIEKPLTVIMITSDKAYDNVEWKWGYRENDRLGGKDPYSASKGMAELAIKSYYESYLISKNSNIKLGIARAGNVIGGGDWAVDRIIPDCVRSWSCNESVEVRNPNATRPWQHVLEPLSGYLTLGALIDKKDELNGQAYNFGPNATQDYSVSQLIIEMMKYWDNVEWKDSSNNHEKHHEAGLLKLNCDKALFDLNWNSALDFHDTVKFTVEWYKNFYENKDADMREFCEKQIRDYTAVACQKKIKWASND
jgi:CDP-glucose 4,6-dehydratase